MTQEWQEGSRQSNGQPRLLYRLRKNDSSFRLLPGVLSLLTAFPPTLTPLFPPTFSQLISVGEQTGNLDEMFTSVSNYYEAEFDNEVENMSSLIEPIMIVFMGTLIGGLMIAMYSPIFNVGAIMGK